MGHPKSVLIIGGGVIGLCIAHYATEAGHRVRILERGAPNHDSCSLGNAGMIVPSHIVPLAAPGMVGLGMRMLGDPESPFAIRPTLNKDLLRWGWLFTRAATEEHVARSAPLLLALNTASRREYVAFAERRQNDLGLVQRGLLMLCKSAETLREEAHLAERARALGMDAQLLSAAQTQTLDPQIDMEVAGSVYFPQDCHLAPQKFVAGLTEDLQARGVEFLWQTEAEGWRKLHDKIEGVVANREVLTADEYVLAGGAWSSQMTASLGFRLPLLAGKGYSLTLPAPRQLPKICAILTEARVAVTPMGESLRFAGTMELTHPDLSINQRRVQGLLKSIPKYYPAFNALDFHGVPVWSGLRPCSPDGLPYIGRLKRYKNLSIATGHAMMGVSLAPVTGRLMCQILSDETPEIDLHLLSPERYA